MIKNYNLWITWAWQQKTLLIPAFHNIFFSGSFSWFITFFIAPNHAFIQQFVGFFLQRPSQTLDNIIHSLNIGENLSNAGKSGKYSMYIKTENSFPLNIPPFKYKNYFSKFLLLSGKKTWVCEKFASFVPLNILFHR